MKPIWIIALLIAIGGRLSLAQTPNANPVKQGPPATVQSKKPEESSPDLAAIRAGSDKFVAAFNKHDAAALAALWTAGGEYIDDSGRAVTGRDAIERDYTTFFADNADAQIQIAIDSLRLLSDDVAIEDGRALVEPPPPGAAGVSKYTAVHAKVDGKWLMASVRDTWIEAQITRQSVADLDWLIGTWVAEEYGVKNESVCSWVAGGNFVQRNYTTTQVDGTKMSGVQLIGWNPLEDRLESWSFSPDGGHDFGVWSPVQGGWRSEMRGVTGAGIPTTSVNLLRRLDDNAYVWQSTQRSVGGMPLPDTEEVVIKRQPTKPASPTPEPATKSTEP